MYIRKLIVPVIFLMLTIITGTLGYIWTEKLSLFDSIWLAAVSILTIGYGDIAPVTPQGKIFTLIIIPIAIGLVTYILAQFASSIIDGNLAREVKKRMMDKKINKLTNHIIICGHGRVGKQVVSQLQNERKPFVIIEKNEEVIDLFPDSFLYVFGDAKEEQTLIDAGIKNASSIILTLPDDADNLFITLTAKGIHPGVQTISRAENDHSEKILYQAGVDNVINTSSIGGKRMAMSVLKPHSVEYVDTLLHNNDVAYSLEEIKISETSPLVNTSLKESKIRELYGVSIVAIKRKNVVISNPNADERIQTNDLIIVFGAEHQMKNFETVAF
ncbi:potassium channel family protein [Neobacillus sp. LXY-4]|uniref:potassium channel family protein n=1 Tax=Neobacillus sp. LXY-4 TaxID=3379826 RepID=UPI003EE268B4